MLRLLTDSRVPGQATANGHHAPDPARVGVAGGIYQECLHELQRPYAYYVKAQALATLSLVETLREVAGQVANLSDQITPSSGDDPHTHVLSV